MNVDKLGLHILKESGKSPVKGGEKLFDQKIIFFFKYNKSQVLIGTNDNSLTDVTLGNILSNTGWTWNAKFADLDNDQWQDLLAVNGCWWDKKIYNMNCFFKNKEGQGFALAQVGA